MTGLTKRQRTSGGVLIPLLIVAILVVLFLMWQAGMFGGNSSAPENSSQPESSQTDSLNAAAATTPAESASSANISETASTANTSTPFTPQPLPDVQGKSPDEIDALVTALMNAHPQNLTPCFAEPDANKALDCAAAEQNRVLAEVFEDFNTRVAAGDATATERGGVAMQRIVQELQKELESFVQAADGS